MRTGQLSLDDGYRRFSRRVGNKRLLQGDAWRDWERTLEGVLAGLGSIGWSRLHRWLSETLAVPVGSEVVLSLPLALASVPVAAVREPMSGRYFIDDFAVRRIPDAAWLIRCERRARECGRQQPALLAVLDPSGDLACDPDWPLKHWQLGGTRCEVLAGASATRGRVLQRLPVASHYVHYGHGSRRRQRCVLELAGESFPGCRAEELDGAQVRDLKLDQNRLCILAACESGLGPREHKGEFNGMAASFLQAGSACVIGCLWSVESSTTGRLIERVLGRHLGGGAGPGLRPAQALRLAQIELRDSASGSRAAAGALLHLRPAGSRMAAVERVCENHLYYWAPFSCLGG